MRRILTKNNLYSLTNISNKVEDTGDAARPVEERRQQNVSALPEVPTWETPEENIANLHNETSDSGGKLSPSIASILTHQDVDQSLQDNRCEKSPQRVTTKRKTKKGSSKHGKEVQKENRKNRRSIVTEKETTAAKMDHQRKKVKSNGCDPKSHTVQELEPNENTYLVSDGWDFHEEDCKECGIKFTPNASIESKDKKQFYYPCDKNPIYICRNWCSEGCIHALCKPCYMKGWDEIETNLGGKRIGGSRKRQVNHRFLFGS